MEEDDLLGHRFFYVWPLAHKLAFERGVHVIEKQKSLFNKGFSKEILSLAPETQPFRDFYNY